ncbi:MULTISPECIES: porin Omp33-36 [unclassified Acinetobacter]|uniref:porin Omp33-36 n=1 Tax=unclassified Acinetobacter TaxID=196816 RepID=UPI0015D2D1C9|nr:MULTISPECIES: porin Omp33-36 [unclassified Acinetobacter]
MKKLGLATALLLAMTGAQAYQFEVQGQAEYIDTTANDKDFTGGVQGTYYLKNVDSTKGPLAEAAFLNQASNVSVAYNYGEVGSKGTDVVAHNFGAKAEAYVPTKVVPVYASASYSHTILDSKNANNTDNTDNNGDRYALEIGALPTQNFLVAVGYTSVADQAAVDAFNVMGNGVAKAAAEATTIGQDQDAITARTKYVGAIDDTNMAIGFESGIIYGDDTAFQLKTDLFVTPKLSVGASYAESSFAGTPDSAWGANVNYFITPAVAVGASYVNANYEAEKGQVLNFGDTQTVGVNAKFRF